MAALVLAAGVFPAPANNVGWTTEQAGAAFTHTPYEYKPCPPQELTLVARGVSPSGDKEYTKTFVVSSAPDAAGGAFAESPVQVGPWAAFGIGVAGDKASVKVKLGITQGGPNYCVSYRILVLWNGTPVDAIKWGEDLWKNTNCVAEVTIDKSMVQAENHLSFETGYGRFGINSMVLSSDAALTLLDGKKTAAGFEKIAEKRRFPEVKVASRGKVLLLNRNIRETTAAWREFVLKPVDAEFDEAKLLETLPSSWKEYKLVILETNFEALVEEDRADIVKYVEQGGKLLANQGAYQRLIGLNGTIADSEKAMIGMKMEYWGEQEMRGKEARYHDVSVEEISLPFMNHFSRGQTFGNLVFNGPVGAWLDPAPAAGVLMSLNHETRKGYLIFNPFGKGWFAGTAFPYLEPELILMYRKLVRFALDGAEPKRP
ncbi:MAG: hypothetical protein IT578_04175 [Verrucomicrobiae bacterium]|nr:hypothetical protein [Verrucomicrobiae bacterium]